MKGPERIETPRLLLRKPVAADAEALFARYTRDPEVTKFMSWPMHRSIEDTRDFLAFSDAEWARWPAGAYLIESRIGPHLLGSTGFGFKTPTMAETGYVLAKDAWGQGFATEALGAMVALARDLGIHRLQANCHSGHRRSMRVLEKCEFGCEGLLVSHLAFPNLNSGELADCYAYSRMFD